jgi:hypothetical protein
MQQRLPQYQKILGENANLSQAQLLFELGQRAFNFAGNVDDAGRPLRGGFFSRAAQASRTLPASMSKFITEADRQQRQLKLLAMQAAEKDIDQVTAANQALTREQRALAAEVVKGEARRKAEAAKALGVSMFGKGDWHWNVVNQPNLLARWASGQTNDTENGLIQSALVEMRRPTTYQGPDPNNPSQVITFTRPGEVPDFAKRFEQQPMFVPPRALATQRQQLPLPWALRFPLVADKPHLVDRVRAVLGPQPRHRHRLSSRSPSGVTGSTSPGLCLARWARYPAFPAWAIRWSTSPSLVRMHACTLSA